MKLEGKNCFKSESKSEFLRNSCSMYGCHPPLIMRIIDPQYINRAPMQLHCQMQDKNEGNSKEDRQGRGLDRGAQHSKGPRLKTPLKEDSLTNLSNNSKTNKRYELSLCNLSGLGADDRLSSPHAGSECSYKIMIMLVGGSTSSPLIALSDGGKKTQNHFVH